MKQWKLVLLVCVALLAPAVVRAHEGHLHKAMGTVATIEMPHVGVKTTDGKTLTIMFDKETVVTRGGAKLDASAVRVGDRVSVDYMEDQGMNMAHAVKLATSAAKK